MLFDDFDRTDATPARPGESRFDFLNRSASRYFGAVRGFMEAWLAQVPSEAQRDLVGALRGQNRQHEAAFWELYLHEGYRCSGATITIHPAVPGATARPDFLIELGAAAFYLEAVSVGLDPAAAGEDRRLEAVYAVLHDMRIEDFSIGVETYGIGAQALATKPLRHALRSWLGGLDPDQVYEETMASTAVGFDRLPQLAWEREGWSLLFTATPLIAEARGRPRRALGMMGPGEAVLVDNITGVRRVLDAKYGKYGVLDLPLVIAVQSNTEYPTRDYEVEQALYGISSRRPADPTLEPHHLIEEGFWRTKMGWRRADCPQVITVYDLAPWTVRKVAPRVWTTLEPDIAPVLQPPWLRPMVVEDQSLPGDGLDLVEFFDVPELLLTGDPDFDLD